MSVHADFWGSIAFGVFAHNGETPPSSLTNFARWTVFAYGFMRRTWGKADQILTFPCWPHSIKAEVRGEAMEFTHLPGPEGE